MRDMEKPYIARTLPPSCGKTSDVASPQILTTRFDSGGCDLAQIAAVMQSGVGNP